MLRLAAEPKRWISVTAAVSLFSLQTCLPEQVARDDAVHHLQSGRHQLALCGQQQAQGDGQPRLANLPPLAHRHTRDDMVEQMGRRLGHAPGPARRPNALPLAAERHQFVVAAVTATQPQEAVGQDAAFEKGVELTAASAAGSGGPWFATG